MPIYEKLTLLPQSNVISGLIGGTPIHCTFRPGGAVPPPGNYDVLPPTDDPIYGRCALMVRQEGQGPSSTFDPTKRAAPALRMWGAFPALDVASFPSSGSGFVLSDRPIPGRNCLVCVSGFADLMEGLESSGGASIQIGL